MTTSEWMLQVEEILLEKFRVQNEKLQVRLGSTLIGQFLFVTKIRTFDPLVNLSESKEEILLFIEGQTGRIESFEIDPFSVEDAAKAILKILNIQ